MLVPARVYVRGAFSCAARGSFVQMSLNLLRAPAMCACCIGGRYARCSAEGPCLSGNLAALGGRPRERQSKYVHIQLRRVQRCVSSLSRFMAPAELSNRALQVHHIHAQTRLLAGRSGADTLAYWLRHAGPQRPLTSFFRFSALVSALLRTWLRLRLRLRPARQAASWLRASTNTWRGM